MRRTIAMANAGQIHRRRGGVFELFVNANLFFFQGAAAIPVSSNLPSRRANEARHTLQARCLFGCLQLCFGCMN